MSCIVDDSIVLMLNLLRVIILENILVLREAHAELFRVKVQKVG